MLVFAVDGEALTSVGTAAAALRLGAVPEGRESGLAACRCMCDLLSMLLSKGFCLRKDHALNVNDDSHIITQSSISNGTQDTTRSSSSSVAAVAAAAAAAAATAATAATGGGPPQPGVGTHLRLRGLPWDVTDEAVIRFLKPVVNVTPADVCVCVGLDVGSCFS
ncbi:hypothetical protein ACSSS7_000720 [Eimeria intestinalis]